MMQRLQSRMNKLMKIFHLLLLFSLSLIILHASAAVRVGGWSPISNVTDPYVVEIGQFAVSEYDRQSKSELKFVSVVRGESQVVSGTNYRLVVEVTGDARLANEGGASKNYEAMVWEKPWLKYRNLTYFKPATNRHFL